MHEKSIDPFTLLSHPVSVARQVGAIGLSWRTAPRNCRLDPFVSCWLVSHRAHEAFVASAWDPSLGSCSSHQLVAARQ